MENKTIEEMKSFFDELNEYPQFLHCPDRYVINPCQAVKNHISTIEDLEQKYGKPRKTDDVDMKANFNEMLRRKKRLLNIYYAIQDKSNWMNKLPVL